MTRETKSYELKIYDQSLMRFEAAYDAFGSLKLEITDIDSANAHLLPLNLIVDQDEKSLASWMEGRTIPKNRAFVEQILSTAGLTRNDILGILDVSKGLSINDSYWLDDGKSDVTFDEINLFDNRFDEVLGLVAYTGYTPSQKHKAGVSSEWTLGGQFPKAVRRINDRLLLFKTGTSGARNLGKEPYSEYFAAQVAKRMGIDHVSYDLEMWKGKLASVCGLMNDKEISFVPFFVAAGDASFPAALSILNELDPKMASKYRTMVVFDALICNRDRHGGNFGILRENRTGRLLGLAPVFDHNLSLFAQDDETDYADFLVRSNRYYLPATANIAFNDMAGIVMGAEQHELLRRMIGFEFQNHPTYPLPQDRLGALNHYITEKVRELLRIPIVDEHALCKAMEEKFNEIQATTKIPMLLDSVKMIHKKGLPLSEKAEAVKRGSKVFENTLNKIIPEEDRCRYPHTSEVPRLGRHRSHPRWGWGLSVSYRRCRKRAARCSCSYHPFAYPPYAVFGASSWMDEFGSGAIWTIGLLPFRTTTVLPVVATSFAMREKSRLTCEIPSIDGISLSIVSPSKTEPLLISTVLIPNSAVFNFLF